MVSSKKRQTKKRSRIILTTIPALKNSFDRLEKEVPTILREKTTKQQVRKFQEIWKSIFGRPVEALAAEAYLQVKSKMRGKYTRKMKGGAALAGAPLDFQTRPGIDGVYGSFPEYVTSGLSFYNTINQDQLNKGVRLDMFEPAVPADMGSNQAGGGKKGGGLLGDAAFVAMTRPFSATAPPSIMDDIQTSFQGRELGQSPNASENPLQYK
jgi:hypothetical protein